MYTDAGGYSLAPAGGWWTRNSGIAEYTQNDREKEDTVAYAIRNRFKGRPYNELLLYGAIEDFGDPHFLIPTNEDVGILIVFDILLGVNPSDGWVRLVLRDKGECKRLIQDTAWEYVELAAVSKTERKRRRERGWGHDEYQVYCTDEWPSEQCVLEHFGERRFLGSEIRSLLSSKRHANPRNKQVKEELQQLAADPVSYLADHIAKAAEQREAAKQIEADRAEQDKKDAERRKKEEEKQERTRIFLMHKAIVDEKRTIKTDEEIDTMIRENGKRLQEEMQKPEGERDNALIGKLHWLLAWHRDWRIHPQDIGFKYTYGVRCPRPRDFKNKDSDYYKTEAVFGERFHIGYDLREAYRDIGIYLLSTEMPESFMMDDIGERSNWHGKDIQEIYTENAKKYYHRRMRAVFRHKQGLQERYGESNFY